MWDADCRGMPSSDSTPVVLSAALIALTLGVLDGIRQYLPIFVDVDATTIGVWFFGFSVLEFLLVPVTLFALAYWAGTRIDVPRTYGSFAVQVGVVGMLLSFFGHVAVVLAAGSGVNSFLLLPSLGLRALTRGTTFGIVGVAGAAVAHFRKRNP